MWSNSATAFILSKRSDSVVSTRSLLLLNTLVSRHFLLEDRFGFIEDSPILPWRIMRCTIFSNWRFLFVRSFTHLIILIIIINIVGKFIVSELNDLVLWKLFLNFKGTLSDLIFDVNILYHIFPLLLCLLKREVNNVPNYTWLCSEE